MDANTEGFVLLTQRRSLHDLYAELTAVLQAEGQVQPHVGTELARSLHMFLGSYVAAGPPAGPPSVSTSSAEQRRSGATATSCNPDRPSPAGT